MGASGFKRKGVECSFTPTGIFITYFVKILIDHNNLPF